MWLSFKLTYSVKTEYQTHGYDIPELNIFHAITWTAEAWNNVTDDVIYRCWQRTGIIPEEYGTEDMSIESEENNETVVQSLLNQMGLIDLTATDYIDIDSTLEATQVIDDN